MCLKRFYFTLEPFVELHTVFVDAVQLIAPPGNQAENEPHRCDIAGQTEGLRNQ